MLTLGSIRINEQHDPLAIIGSQTFDLMDPGQNRPERGQVNPDRREQRQRASLTGHDDRAESNQGGHTGDVESDCE